MTFKRACTLSGLLGLCFSCATPAPDPIWSSGDARIFSDSTLTFAGRTFGPYDAIAEPTLSPDGARLAFVAERGEQRIVVLDGVETRPFEHVHAGTLRFSPDSRHFAFVASDGACARIVADLDEGECHDRVSALSIDGDGRVLAVARDGQRDRVIGAAPAEADAIAELRRVNGHVAYAAKHGARWSAVFDGLASAECARVRHLRLGDGGRKTAWVCGEGNHAAVVVDGAYGRWFPKVSAPLVRDDSPAWAYVGHDDAGAWVVTEDTTWGPFGEVTDLVLGARGVSFVTRSNGATTLVHGERRIALPAVVDGSLSVSDDGEHWAVISADVKTRTFWLTVDGERVRALEGKDVFGGARLNPWVSR